MPRPSSSSRVLARACLASLALGAAAPVLATEGGGGVYPYGLNTVASGILPKPGHYLYMYNSVYAADVTTTDDGAAAPIDFEVDVRAHTLRYLRSFENVGMLGGSLGLLVAQPYLVGEAHVGAASGEALDAVEDAERITGYIVTSAFDDLSHRRRQRMLDSALKKFLTPDEFVCVGPIVTMTPAEATVKA